MLYIIYGEDVENSLSLRLSVRDKHIERLKILQTQGKLIIAGPCPAIDSEDPGESGFTGSMTVAEFDSLQAAQAWAEQDPYVLSGIYKKVTVKPYKKVFPA
jgi:uncharacterized protein YciI